MTPKFSRIFALLSATSFLVLLTACESEDPRFSAQTQYLGGVHGPGQVASTAPQDTVSYWDGDASTGKPSVKISLGEQRAYFYRSGQLVAVSQLSTGREGKNTPPGHYKVISKDLHHASSLYGDYVDAGDNVVKENVENGKDPKPPGSHFKGASMPFYMQIAPGFGLHAGYLPGYAASHGCIRMPEFMAENFFRTVSPGTPVMITD